MQVRFLPRGLYTSDMHFSLDYRTKKLAVLASLAVYAAIGISAHWLTTNDELYPVFSWNLFAYVPNPKIEYTIALLSFGKTHYNPPLQFNELGFLFKQNSESPIKYYVVINRLAAAIMQKDPAAQETYRQQLEAIFQKTPAQYEVLKVKNDPLAFWYTKTYVSSSVLATFDTTKP